MDCSRSHEVLTQCDHNGWGVNSCDHSEDVGVVCWPGLTYFLLNTIVHVRDCSSIDEYSMPAGGVSVLDTTGSSITVTWEVCEAELLNNSFSAVEQLC